MLIIGVIGIGIDFILQGTIKKQVNCKSYRSNIIVWTFILPFVQTLKIIYTANEVPHPQVVLALGFLKVNPRLFSPSCQSTCIPSRYIS